MADAKSRGWGPGWPICQTSKIVPLTVSGTTFPGGVRREIHELISRLIQETKNRGYRFGTRSNPSYGCWGYSCRPVAGTKTASNHSWGLAVDINAPTNPQKRPLTTNMPSWMPALWKDYGFRWGGTYIGLPDAMHYEFLGTPADAARLTTAARKNQLGEKRVPVPPRPPIPPVIPVTQGDTFMLIVHGMTALFLSGGKLVRVESQADKVNLSNSGADVWSVSEAQLRTLIKAYGAPVDA